MENYKNLTDTELVNLYQITEDREAFGHLYYRYNQKTFLYCAKILSNRDKAMDVTQEVFIKVSTNINKLQDACTFVKWLFTIAHNACMDLLKKENRYRYRALDLYDAADTDARDFEEVLRKEQQLDCLNEVLQVMPDKYRAFLEEKYVQGLSIAELMTKYALSESAVKMRLSRSRDRLKDMVLEYHVAEA